MSEAGTELEEAMYNEGYAEGYAAGRRDALTKAHKIALQQRCERGTPWDLACVTIADLIEAQAQGGEHGPI